MSSTVELDNKIFYVLPTGDQEPIGPFTEVELVSKLNRHDLERSDLVYYPALGDWRPLDEVFDFHQGVSNFGGEGQDEATVNESFTTVTDVLDPGEEIYYIAVQNLGAQGITTSVILTMPQSVVLSTEGFYIISPQLIGDPEIVGYPFGNIASVSVELRRIAEDSFLSIGLRSGRCVEIKKIPMVQMRRIEVLANRFLTEFV